MTPDGYKIPEYKFNDARDIIGKSINLYGPSGCGKTVALRNFLKLINGYVNQALVVCPSEPTNQSYKGMFSPAVIHYSFDIGAPPNQKIKPTSLNKAKFFFEKTWERQEMLSTIYAKVNELGTLHKLYQRLTTYEKQSSEQIIYKINSKRMKTINLLKLKNLTQNILNDKITKINDRCEKLLISLYKKYIENGRYRLAKLTDLSDSEKYSLKYLNINPNLVLVMDDCGADLKKIQKEEVFQRLYIRGRHAKYTIFNSLQDDTQMDLSLRKNIFVSIFLDKAVALVNFNRKGNGYSKQETKKAESIINTIFDSSSEETKYRCLLYMREDPTGQNYYHYTANDIRNFPFGSKEYIQLCKAVENNEISINSSNSFYDAFKV